MDIRYEVGLIPGPKAVVALYRDAGLRRPIDDPARIAEMYANSNLVITAWAGDTLVGVSRALTDRGYCCYLSDLAVARAWQRQGIGKALIARTRAEIGPRCSCCCCRPSRRWITIPGWASTRCPMPSSSTATRSCGGCFVRNFPIFDRAARGCAAREHAREAPCSSRSILPTARRAGSRSFVAACFRARPKS